MPAETQITPSAGPSPNSPQPSTSVVTQPTVPPQPCTSAEPQPCLSPQPSTSGVPQTCLSPQPSTSGVPQPFLSPVPPQSSTQTIIIGQAVNATSCGYPYLAGVVTGIDGDMVNVYFPGRRNCGPFTYPMTHIRPFASQFVDERYVPLKVLVNRPVHGTKLMVKTYESKLHDYLRK